MNNSTNATGPTISSPSEAERIFKVVFYVFLFITGTIGNLLVVVIIRAKHKHRTVNDYFILNLAVSDLTFLCFALPFYYYELFEKFEKFEFYCKFVWPMMSITLLVSIFTLTLMAVERCRAILFPFRPRIKKHTLFLAMGLVWILSILCMVPLMVVARPVGVHCLEKWPTDELRKAYTAALFVLQFAMPITVIAVAYITIAVTLVKTKVPNRTSVNQRGQLIKQKTRADNIHVIRTVAIIVILFVICMLPNQIAWILMDFGGKKYHDLSEKFWLLAEALMFFHSGVNPIIYGTLTRQFRDGYVQYLRYVFCCGRRYTLHGMTITEQSNFAKSRVAGRLGKVSFKSPTTVNGIRTSCQAGPTVITSSRCGTSLSPPSPARSAASSVRSHPSSVRSYPNPARSHASLVQSHPSPVRPHPNSKELLTGSKGIPNESRPPSPLIIDNKTVIDAKLTSVMINDINLKYKDDSSESHFRKGNRNSTSKQKLSSKDSKISVTKLNGECRDSTVLKNPNVHDSKNTMDYSPKSSISQSRGNAKISQSKETNRISQSKDTAKISQSKETNRINQSGDTARISQSKETTGISLSKDTTWIIQSEDSSIHRKMDDKMDDGTSKDAGSSDKVDDDEPTAQDTYL